VVKTYDCGPDFSTANVIQFANAAANNLRIVLPVSYFMSACLKLFRFSGWGPKILGPRDSPSRVVAHQLISDQKVKG